jgi:hypothetical protein
MSVVGSLSSNFWRGERLKLRALEPNDLDILITDEPDSAAEQAEGAVSIPQSRAWAHTQLQELAARDRSDDSCFLAIVTVAGELTGLINTLPGSASYPRRTWRYEC